MDTDMAILLAVALIAFLQLEIRYPIETKTWMQNTLAAERQRPVFEAEPPAKAPGQSARWASQ